MIRQQTQRHIQTGFSLIETLVAFAILSLVLAVIFQIYGTGARSARLANEYTQATIIAQSKLASAQTGNTQSKSGIELDKYNWTLQQQAHDYSDIGTPPYQHVFRSYNINVTVTWQSAGKQRQIQLTTVRLANKK